MKLITKQSKVIPAIQNFFASYKRHCGPNAPFYTKERYARMITLVPETCTVEQFNEALGVTHWMDNHCHECGEDFDSVVMVGQDPDYDSATAHLCKGCLVKALGML